MPVQVALGRRSSPGPAAKTVAETEQTDAFCLRDGWKDHPLHVRLYLPRPRENSKISHERQYHVRLRRPEAAADLPHRPQERLPYKIPLGPRIRGSKFNKSRTVFFLFFHTRHLLGDRSPSRVPCACRPARAPTPPPWARNQFPRPPAAQDVAVSVVRPSRAPLSEGPQGRSGPSRSLSNRPSHGGLSWGNSPSRLLTE